METYHIGLRAKWREAPEVEKRTLGQTGLITVLERSLPLPGMVVKELYRRFEEIEGIQT